MTQNTTAGLSFGARTAAYKKFRLSYPPELHSTIESLVPPERRGLAVDVGSGTGHSVLPLIGRFRNVIAVEPDARMANEIPPSANLEVRNVRAEEAEFAFQSVDLVTCGTAFYWMDGPVVLDRIRRWLKPESPFAIFRYALPELPPAVGAILDREFRNHWDKFRHVRLLDEDYSRRVVEADARFVNKQVHRLPLYTEMTAESFTGFFGSTSYVGAYLRTIANGDEYLSALEREVAQAVDGKEFRVNFPTELIVGFTLPAEDWSDDVC
jgi:SAM-dependent methyltransferase